MTKATDILARIAMIVAMVLCVSGLMRLFDEAPPVDVVAEETHAAQHNAGPAETEPPVAKINYLPAYDALNPYQAAAAGAAHSLFDPADDYWGLPRSEGYETVAAYCAACHTLQIVMQQHLPRERWDYLLNWMVQNQGMAEPPEDMRSEILDYLAREFSEAG